MTLTRRSLAGLAAGAALLTIFQTGLVGAADVTLNIGYQPIVEPSRVPQADGTYEKVTGAKINWQKFDGGADVIAAIASGSLDIGYVGSSPLAAAASRELPIETIARGAGRAGYRQAGRTGRQEDCHPLRFDGAL